MALLVEAGSLKRVCDDHPWILGDRLVVVRVGVLDGHQERGQRVEVVGKRRVLPPLRVPFEVSSQLPRGGGGELPILPRLRERYVGIVSGQGHDAKATHGIDP